MSKIIAIDGPAGSGKGTLAKELAKKYNLINIDTGATYRCVALKVLKENINIDDKERIIEISSNIKIELKQEGRVFLDDIEVTKEIRSKEVSNIVSIISSIPEVRRNMVNIQRKLAENKNIVMEGRDITTVVFPDAKYKFYLDASIESRAQRRYKELREKGNMQVTYDEVLSDMKFRDANDSSRAFAPLKQAEDAYYLDSSDMTIDEVVNEMKKDIIVK